MCRDIENCGSGDVPARDDVDQLCQNSVLSGCVAQNCLGEIDVDIDRTLGWRCCLRAMTDRQGG